MGNNNSHQTPPPSSVDIVRRPPSRPDAPPSAKLTSELGPRGPSYHSPENQVLPKELPSILKLRPVSMEIKKYNPDYQDIYGEESKENLDSNENEIEMNGDINDELKPSSPPRPPPPVQNGHIPSSIPTSPVSQLPNGNLQAPAKPSTSNAKTPYRPSHRRQMSLGQEHTIMEEPEESIESRVKLDPLMQSFPGATGPSLPVKNNFNLDYSYQLTYVQLAEHRRNKTIEELERRTGKRLSDLSADLSEHTEKPAFIRDAPSRVSSRSSGSGVSSKKKKAPPPPGQAPPPPPTNQPYSVDNEPPIDYDMDSPRKPSPSSVVLPRYSNVPPVSRVSPSVSKVPPPPPPPPGVAPKKAAVNLSRTPSMSNGTPEIILRKTPDIKPVSKEQEGSDGKIPWLLEIKNLSEARATRRQQSMESSETPDVPQSDETVADVNETENSLKVEDKETVKPKLVFESSSESFASKQESEEKSKTENKNSNATVERSSSFKETEKLPASTLLRHHSTTGYDHSASGNLQRQTSEPAKPVTAADPVRRLSSLLQHDIRAAANAKCHKIKKQTTPVPPKPKDPHTIFREQLQKAAAARDERAKTEGTIDEKLKLNTSTASFDFGAEDLEDTPRSNTTPRKEKTEPVVKEGPSTLPKPPRYHKNVTRNTSYSKVQSPRDFRDRQAVSMSLDWTPEDDLDSDDNLSDREVMTKRHSSVDGFKSTIIPNTMTDMKAKKKGKGKKDSSLSDEQNKNKFGSVRKLKKSMHKSVKNAFGSISKASGKILRKQRSEDFETVDDAPKNWSMTSNGNKQNDRSSKYRIPLSYEQDEESDSDIEQYRQENEFSEVVFRQNGRRDSEESEDSTYESEDKAPQNIRRAGVAYISAKGQLVLMKDEDEEEMLENKRKKEKKKKNKDRSEDQWEKERKQEEERRKQLEMELELHKQREAETRERLERLESAHLQQQLLQQQQQQQHQQQQQNLGVLSAPPLPPAGNFSSYGTLPDPSRAQTQTFTNIFGQQLPQNGYQPNFGLYTQTGTYNPATGMPYDLNDYMRMLGVQSPPTSQQMAFFLNNMTLTNQPFDRKSNPALFDMFNQQYPNGTLNYQGMDTSSLKKSAFQNWASTPNINMTSSMANSVPLSDFVASYNGANKTNIEKEDEKKKSRNPLYNSDDSDSGLSPQKSVARAQVKDYRKIPVRTESGKFMKKYGSENYVTQNNQDTKSNFSDTNKSLTNLPYNEGLPQQQRSVSPSNSVSTVDSAMSATSVTLSTPSSPARSTTGVPASPTLISRSQNSAHGFKTVLDLSSPEGGSMQIISTSGDPVKL